MVVEVHSLGVNRIWPQCILFLFVRQITVTTQDKRKAHLVFKASLIEMNSKILVDFRLSRVSLRKRFYLLRDNFDFMEGNIT